MSDFKILLVDDEEDFVTTLAERLDLRDLSSNVAFGGMQAMKELNGSAMSFAINASVNNRCTRR